VPPLTKKIIQIHFRKPALKAGVEYSLLVSSKLKQKELWAPAGHEVSWDQLPLPWTQALPEKPLASGNIKIETADDNVRILGDGFAYTFDRKTGSLTSISAKGKELLAAPVRFNVWRAPLANEQDDWNSRNAYTNNWIRDGFGQQVATEFYSLGIDSLTTHVISFDAFTHNGRAHINIRTIESTSNNAPSQRDMYISGAQYNGFENLYDYVIGGDGELRLHHTVLPQGKMPLWLPRTGLTMTLDKSLQQVEWYGRGPQENYPDRKTGYRIGRYQTTVDDMYVPYLIPQDYGLRTDNRYVRMTDGAGGGLEFRVNELFNFNAYPYSTDNLTKAMYTYQLQKQDGITFNLDYATSGTGCTARSIFNSYRAMPSRYERTVTIMPL